MKILVISYKQNSADYCRGCLMATFDSDQEVEIYDSIEKAATGIAFLNSKKRKHGEAKYEHRVYVLGEEIPELSEEEDETKWDVFSRLNDAVTVQVMSLANEITVELIEKRLAEEAKKNETLEAQLQAEKDNQSRELYEELKKKFEGK